MNESLLRKLSSHLLRRAGITTLGKTLLLESPRVTFAKRFCWARSAVRHVRVVWGGRYLSLLYLLLSARRESTAWSALGPYATTRRISYPYPPAVKPSAKDGDQGPS